MTARGYRARQLILVAGLIAIAGCRAAAPARVPIDRADRESMTLEQIPVPPVLPMPVAPQPVFARADALRFYSAGRSDLSSNQPAMAVDDFTRAAAADPRSADVQFDLGRAQEQAGNRDAAIDAYDHAATLDTDAVAPLLAAGRLLQQSGRSDEAVDRLHRATKLAAIEDDGEGVAVHLWLARALGSAGYLVAALNQYNLVIDRLNHPAGDVRDEPSIMDVLRRPVILDLDRADLLEHEQQYDLAVEVLTRAADTDPADVQVADRLVADLIKTDHPDRAVLRAEKLVMTDHADPESVAVLTRACAASVPPVDVAAVLLKAAGDHPSDPALRMAAVNALTESNRSDDAFALCARCHSANPADPSATADLVKQLLRASRPIDAVSAVIETAAADPDAVDRLESSWSAITRPGKKTLLTPADLADLSVPANQAGARDWYLSRLYDDLHRKGESAAALATAVGHRPIFPPAFHDAMSRIRSDPRQTADWKRDRGNSLCRAAEAAGEPWLSAELRGIALADSGNTDAACAAFSAARQMNPHSAEVRFEAARAAGNPQQVQFALWQNVSDFPAFVGSYRALQAAYLADPRSARDELEKLAAVWTTNLPDDGGGFLLEARLAADRGDDTGAEKILSEWTDRAPGDAAVFDAARAFYSRTGKLESLARRLQARLEARPRDVPVVAEVVTLYTSMNRAPEAVRVLDAARIALVENATGLYPLANLYAKAGEPGAAVGLLRDVLKLDPDFAAACNDLAFYLIDDGTDLPGARAQIDRALKLEPDNPAFLDSLGWLQYKQGDFKAAVETLRKAVGPATGGEAVVLDHFGDALSKSGQTAEAKDVWAKALAALGNKPDAQPTLRLQLLQKIGKPATARAEAAK